MNIVGVDYSVNSPACFKISYDESMKPVAFDYIGFTDTIKISNIDAKLFYYRKDQFKDYISQIIWFRQHIWDFMKLSQDDIVAFEGYAFMANGRIFNIAEATFSLKEKIYENGNPIKLYPPKTMKKFFADSGNANKEMMISTFNNSEYSYLLKHLPDRNSPKEDLVDAFYVAKLLECEEYIRKGIIDRVTLNKKQTEVLFKCVNKKNTILFNQDFLKKDKNVS